MSLRNVVNAMGIPLDSIMQWSTSTNTYATVSSAGGYMAALGQVYLEGGTGSKTISGAGGKIVFNFASLTFNNSATNIRIGIQDVTGSTGTKDGTYDVYANFVGGTGTLTTGWQEKSMTSGSKTINHLDTIAIVTEMTARGGTDQYGQLYYEKTTFISRVINYPRRDYYNTGQSNYVMAMYIIFDDGSLGWIASGNPPPFVSTNNTISYHVNSSLDEYASVFKVPYKCSINGGYVMLGNAVPDFEIILYSDAESTPVSQSKFVVNNAISAKITNAPYMFATNSTTLYPNIWYALAVRPTTTTALSCVYNSFGTLGNKYKKMLPFGVDCKVSARADQAGPFVEVSSSFMPIFGLFINGFDDETPEYVCKPLLR